MKKLSEEIVVKTNLLKNIIESFAIGVFYTIVVYIILEYLRKDIIGILTTIEEGKISAFTMVSILFPGIVILVIMIRLAKIVIYRKEKKN